MASQMSVRQSHDDNYEAAIGRDYHLTFEEATTTKLNIIVKPGFEVCFYRWYRTLLANRRKFYIRLLIFVQLNYSVLLEQEMSKLMC